MAPLTKHRAPTERDAEFNGDPVAAGAKIFRGALVALDPAGNAIPAVAGAPKLRGVAMEGADNTSGADGDVTVTTRKSTFLLGHTGLDRTNIGDDVFVVDDATVGAAGTLIAGKLVDVTTGGAWVDIS